jgi:hypothetical protein
MLDFLSFDRFITPGIIRVVFVLGLLLIALGTLVCVLIGIGHLRLFHGVLVPLSAMCLFALLWRIYGELILVFFDIREKLTTIADRSATP